MARPEWSSFFWAVVTSFESVGATFKFPRSLWLREPTLRNYWTMVETVLVSQYVFNSVLVSVFGCC